LQKKLLAIEQVIEQLDDASEDISEEKAMLISRIEDASQEFEKNITTYQSWFDFYQSAVRDFTIREIIEAAQQMVWDINYGAIKDRNIQKADCNCDKGIDNIYIKGKNFTELLEVFKILFQNVVYHADNEIEDEKNITISVSHKEKERYQNYLSIEFSSDHTSEVDTATLWEIVKNESLRQQAIARKQGTGLPTIEDILLNRLQGAEGRIDSIDWNKETKKFSIIFHLNIIETGAPVEHTTEETLQTISVDTLTARAKAFDGIKVLIVEDQKAKYDAIEQFVSNQLTDCQFIHTWDIETTCRLLTDSDVHFDLIVLDMTLPEDAFYMSYLKALGGLSVLKVMRLKNINTPTVVATQYSNWSAEADQNTRVFLQKLNRYCLENFGDLYKGSIRFSHTEYEWRWKFKDIINTMKKDSLAVRLSELTQKKQKLYQEQMMSTFGQMARGMAHEFRTPLQAIKSLAQVGTDFIKKGVITKEDIAEYFEKIINQVNKMEKQVQHIHALATDDQIKTEWINVNDVIERAFEFFNQQLKSHSILLKLDLHKKLPLINANSYRVEQIFINLIQNSRDALENIRGRKKEIHVKTIATRGRTPLIIIYFQDNGIGVKESVRDKIFEPFFTTKGPQKGMGIGLTIVKEIVSDMGGTVKLQNDSSTGASFVIELPVKEKEK
jgi:signal transduction histidine kinase